MNNKTFINDNFLLQNKYAEELYRSYAKEQPIIDYHCHLSQKEIAEDKNMIILPRYGSMETITNGVLCVL